MRCQRCHQENPPTRETCWNCGDPLEEPPAQPAAREPARPAEPPREPAGAATCDTDELGTLGPLRKEPDPARARAVVMRRIPEERTPAARQTRDLMVRAAIGGALTGGAALGIIYGLLVAAAAERLEQVGLSRGATFFVSVGTAAIAGAIEYAVVGALVAYYGGGTWAGAKMGGAINAGMWVVQAMAAGDVALATPSIIARGIVAMAVVGAAIGALVGAAVDALRPD